MAKRYDAIIVGGGHNGLVAAAYLARAGREVLVLEQRHIVGGATVTEELHPGFKYSVFSYVVSLLRPEIMRDLSLARHGLEILPLESTFTPLPGGDYLLRGPDHAQTHREIYRHSPRDADVYDEYGRLNGADGHGGASDSGHGAAGSGSTRLARLAIAGTVGRARARAGW